MLLRSQLFLDAVGDKPIGEIDEADLHPPTPRPALLHDICTNRSLTGQL